MRSSNCGCRTVDLAACKSSIPINASVYCGSEFSAFVTSMCSAQARVIVPSERALCSLIRLVKNFGFIGK